MESKEAKALRVKASKYVEKNKLKKALKVYWQLLKLECRDAGLHMKVGDLNRRLGKKDDAVRLYSRAGELYAKDGMLIQGMAACKVILDIDPEHTGTQEILADLYTRKYGSLPRKKDHRIAPVPPAENPVAEVLGDKEPPEVNSFTPVEIAFFGVDGDLMDEDDGIAAHGEGSAGDEEISLTISEPPTAYQPVEEIEFVFEEEIPSPSLDELPRIPLFSDLDTATFIELLNRVPLRHYEGDDFIVREGDHGESFFVLVSGNVRVLKGADLQIAELGPGAFFGEISIVVNRPRRASVQAIDASSALEISKMELDRLCEEYPHIQEVLRRFAEQRLLHNLMLTSPIFTPFPPDEKKDLVRRFTPELFARDRDLITEGEHSTGLFLIASGAATVLKQGAEGTLDTVATLCEGDICGEMSLMTREPATATVRALQDSRVLRLPEEVFSEIIMTHPQILMLISELADTRNRETRDSLSRALVSSEDGGSAPL